MTLAGLETESVSTCPANPFQGPSPAGAAQSGALDPDLQLVIDVWPSLPEAVRTNIVRFRHDASDALLAHLADHGVLAGTVGPGIVRLVTHLDIDDAGIDVARSALASAP